MLKAVKEPSFVTGATTASGEQTVKNVSNQRTNYQKMYEDYRSGAEEMYNSKSKQKSSEAL